MSEHFFFWDILLIIDNFEIKRPLIVVLEKLRAMPLIYYQLNSFWLLLWDVFVPASWFLRPNTAQKGLATVFTQHIRKGPLEKCQVKWRGVVIVEAGWLCVFPSALCKGAWQTHCIITSADCRIYMCELPIVHKLEEMSGNLELQRSWVYEPNLFIHAFQLNVTIEMTLASFSTGDGNLAEWIYGCAHMMRAWSVSQAVMFICREAGRQAYGLRLYGDRLTSY